MLIFIRRSKTRYLLALRSEINLGTHDERSLAVEPNPPSNDRYWGEADVTYEEVERRLWAEHVDNDGVHLKKGRDGWTTLALVIDCHTREFLGWHLSRSGKAKTAASALEHALITRFGEVVRLL